MFDEIKPNPCCFGFFLLFFSFKSPNVVFFNVRILKFFDVFSKGAICGIPSTFSSSQNHYQGH